MKKEGFGILTRIKIQETLKKKLDVGYRKYYILGTCDSPFAHRTLQAERMIGLMLPCSVVIQEIEGGKTEVSAIDPVASVQAVQNPELKEVAREVQKTLRRIVENL